MGMVEWVMRVEPQFLTSLVWTAFAMISCADDPTGVEHHKECSGHSQDYCRLTHPAGLLSWDLSIYTDRDDPNSYLEMVDYQNLLGGPYLNEGPAAIAELTFQFNSEWVLLYGRYSAIRAGRFAFDEKSKTISGVDLIWDTDGEPELFENVEIDGLGDAGTELTFEIHSGRDLFFKLESCGCLARSSP